MPADSVQAAGERFARDMRRIREARDVTRDDIHEETRIARTLIETFEQDGLFDHPAFNRVYLRSFVRAYAGCIDVDPSVALDYLESAMNGEYDNDLADQVLGGGQGGEAWPPEPEVPDTDATPTGATPTGATPTGEDGGSSTGDDESPDDSTDADTPSRQGPSDVSPDDLARDQPPTRPTRDEVESGDAARGTSPRQQSEEGGETESEDASSATDSSGPAWPEEDAGPWADESESDDSESDESLTDESGARPASDSDEEEEDASAGPSWAEGMRDRDDDEAPPRPPAGSSVGTPRPVDGDESSASDALEASSRKGSPDPRRSARPGSAWSGGQERQGRGAGSALSSFFKQWGREVVIGGVVLVLAVGVIAGAVAFFGGDGEPEAVEPSPIASDTSAISSAESDTTATTRSTSQPPLANITLGETLHLTVRANEDVAGIRIRRDADLRRPYWIEEGEASVYPFSDRIIVEEELDKVDLFLEQYPYPATATDARGRIVINRDSARAFVDTLRGDPPALGASTDTIPVPPPAPPEPAGDADTETGTEPADTSGN